MPTPLEKLAMRIRARAIRRCGELLKQIEPGKPGPKLQDGTVPQLGRTKAGLCWACRPCRPRSPTGNEFDGTTFCRQAKPLVTSLSTLSPIESVPMPIRAGALFDGRVTAARRLRHG
jgi:hypothetical protein